MPADETRMPWFFPTNLYFKGRDSGSSAGIWYFQSCPLKVYCLEDVENRGGALSEIIILHYFKKKFHDFKSFKISSLVDYIYPLLVDYIYVQNILLLKNKCLKAHEVQLCRELNKK